MYFHLFYCSLRDSVSVGLLFNKVTTTLVTYKQPTVSPLQHMGLYATLHLNNRTYSARLVKADVKRPLLGADFFRQHNLLVDICDGRLIEADTY